MADKLMHLQCQSGQVGRYCILPGDPGRCEKIARHLDEPRLISQNREFTIYTGVLEGERVSVCSTGIGGPSAAIAVEELVQAGADTFVRVGTCGGMNKKVRGGDLVIAQSAVRQEGTTLEYMPLTYPATADFSLTCHLSQAARQLSYDSHVGVVQSKDSFYGQHQPQRMPVSGQLLANWHAYMQAGVLASEMECAAVFVVGAVLGARCGAVLNVVWNQEREEASLDAGRVPDSERAIAVAIEALRLQMAKDGLLSEKR